MHKSGHAVSKYGVTREKI